MTASASAHLGSSPTCPTCGLELHLERVGVLDAWVCPQEHGMGCTLTEAYERVADDEVRTIWQRARTAEPGTRSCPICSATMVAVTVPPEVAGDGELHLDVCLTDELIWFDAGELDQIPVPPRDPRPSAEEQGEIAAITEQFGDDLSTEWSARDNMRLRDHFLHRLH